MKKLILRLLILLGFFLLIISLAYILPANESLKNSLFFAHNAKNKLLLNTESPRIVFIGGSNLSFSINSQAIKDSLCKNPVNMGIDGSFGLKFMMNNSVHYIKATDIVIICPEYHQYYDNSADGDIELLSLLVDISPQYNDIELKQYFNMLKYVPKYASSKIRKHFVEYFNPIDTSYKGIYSINSFNSFGDAINHWNMGPQKFTAGATIGKKMNDDIFNHIIRFRKSILARGAKLYITFPAFQKESYLIDKEKIKEIEKRLIQNNFDIIGTPERYVISDNSMIFNTAYHLTKKGVDYRTQLLIEDLKSKGL